MYYSLGKKKGVSDGEVVVVVVAKVVRKEGRLKLRSKKERPGKGSGRR